LTQLDCCVGEMAAAQAATLAQQPMGALSPSAANKAPQSAAPAAGIKTMK